GSSLAQLATRSAAARVEGSENEPSPRIPNVPAAACALKAERKAERRAFRFTLTSKLRGPGGNTTPPPVNCAARIVPARARPVPFWRHGFARPPETSPRLFAPRLPARRALGSARTGSWTRGGLR